MPRMPPMVRYWLRSSRDDLRAARTLVRGGHYRMAMFCCHLSIEKALKAVLQNQTGVLPPRMHDLRVLLARTGLIPRLSLKRFIDRMTGLSVPTRYPGPLSQVLAGLRKRQVQRAIDATERVVEWCRQNC